jgi:hypothetical protein
MAKVSNALKVGIAGGIAFFAHALVPGSNAWPLLWPALAGMVGVFLAGRNGALGFWGSVRVGLKAGAVAGAVFFVATAAALWLLSTSRFDSFARQLGAEGPIAVSAPVVTGIAIAALLGLAVAALSGGAAYPLSRSKA